MHSRIQASLLMRVLALAAIAAIAVGAPGAHAASITLVPNDPNSSVLLSDLLPGGIWDDGAVVGDKIFSEFFYSTLPNDDMPDANDVAVYGYQDPNGHWGLSFHGAFLDLPNTKPSDALLRFAVEVTPDAIERGWRISDAHLNVGGMGVGPNSFFSVDESFLGVNQTLNAVATTLGGTLKLKTTDSIIFDQLYTKLYVTKDILAYAGVNSDEAARATVIYQSFSQTNIIPEPSTCLAMLSIVGIALGNYRQRQRRPDCS